MAHRVGFSLTEECVAIDREDASCMVIAGATANTTEGDNRASRESGLLCSHSHAESIAIYPSGARRLRRPVRRPPPKLGLTLRPQVLWLTAWVWFSLTAKGCEEKHSHTAAHHPVAKPPAEVSTAVTHMPTQQQGRGNY